MFTVKMYAHTLVLDKDGSIDLDDKHSRIIIKSCNVFQEVQGENGCIYIDGIVHNLSHFVYESNNVSDYVGDVLVDKYYVTDSNNNTVYSHN